MKVQWWCASQNLPWSWTWRPYVGVWLFVLAIAGGYALLRRRGRRRGEAPREGAWGSAVWFGAGLVVLWASLDWPLGTLGASYLASVHMVQFLLTTLLAPPLLLLGIPLWAYRGLDARAHRVLIPLTHPLVTLVLFGSIMAFTHWPPIVDGFMSSQLGSFGLDMLWVASGILFWWPISAPVPERSWLTHPVRMGYILAGTIINTGVFAYLTFAQLPVYATYELAPPIRGITTRDDQILAGLLMKMGGALILWTAMTILFFRWFQQQERDDPAPVAAPAARSPR